MLLCTYVTDNLPKDQEDDGLGKLRKPYHCDVCNQDLTFTTAEALKHRRSCTGQQEDADNDNNGDDNDGKT